MRLSPLPLALFLIAAVGAGPAWAGHVSTIKPDLLKAVLVAGDDSIAVFDNATASMAAWLRARGVPDDNIVRLSATRGAVAALATSRNVIGAIGHMAPAQGGSCLVFATSHGGRAEGLYLSASDDFLAPAMLARALRRGCGTAPTVVVVSACYSGIFVHSQLAQRNDVVMSAARGDRSSFGCEAGRRYTVYDFCLLDALTAASTWNATARRVRLCIGAEEHREQYGPPSEPQTYVGTDMQDAALP